LLINSSIAIVWFDTTVKDGKYRGGKEEKTHKIYTIIAGIGHAKKHAPLRRVASRSVQYKKRKTNEPINTTNEKSLFTSQG